MDVGCAIHIEYEVSYGTKSFYVRNDIKHMTKVSTNSKEKSNGSNCLLNDLVSTTFYFLDQHNRRYN